MPANSWWQTLSAWFGSLPNLAALYAFWIILSQIQSQNKGDKLVLLLGLGTLVLVLILKYADVLRFKESDNGKERPPLGLTRGSF